MVLKIKNVFIVVITLFFIVSCKKENITGNNIIWKEYFVNSETEELSGSIMLIENEGFAMVNKIILEEVKGVLSIENSISLEENEPKEINEYVESVDTSIFMFNDRFVTVTLYSFIPNARFNPVFYLNIDLLNKRKVNFSDLLLKDKEVDLNKNLFDFFNQNKEKVVLNTQSLYPPSLQSFSIYSSEEYDYNKVKILKNSFSFSHFKKDSIVFNALMIDNNFSSDTEYETRTFLKIPIDRIQMNLNASINN